MVSTCQKIKITIRDLNQIGRFFFLTRAKLPITGNFPIERCLPIDDVKDLYSFIKLEVGLDVVKNSFELQTLHSICLIVFFRDASEALQLCTEH